MRKDPLGHRPQYWSFNRYKKEYRWSGLKVVLRRLKVEARYFIGHTYCRLFFKKHREDTKSPDWGGIDFYCGRCGTCHRTNYSNYHKWGDQLQDPALDRKKK